MTERNDGPINSDDYVQGSLDSLFTASKQAPEPKQKTPPEKPHNPNIKYVLNKKNGEAVKVEIGKEFPYKIPEHQSPYNYKKKCPNRTGRVQMHDPDRTDKDSEERLAVLCTKCNYPFYLTEIDPPEED